MQNILLSGAINSVRRNVASRSLRYLTTKPPNASDPSSSSNKITQDKSGQISSTDASPAHPSVPPDPASSSTETLPPSPASLSLDFSPGESHGEKQAQGRTGAKSSKDSLSSIERKRKAAGRVTLAMLGLGMFAGAIYLGRDWEEGELRSRKIPLEDAPSTRLGRTNVRFASMFDFFSKPTWDELLPPPLPAPYQKPYTLLLSVDDLLVTSTWDRQNGWRTAKRPGVDYFLAYMSQFFEIVIFTSQHHYTATPIIEQLDRYGFYITYKLFRESTRSVNGSVKKDLTYLNRDLSKVILLDTDPDHISLQPSNAIILPKWKGDPRDKGLITIIPFLESIAIYKPDDIRPILDAYHGKDIPIEYGKKEAAAKAQFVEEWSKSGKRKSSSSFTLSGLFGGSPEEASPVPLTYLEQKRKEAQQHYAAEQEYIKQNKDEFERLLEADKQAAAAQMTGNLWSMMAGLPPPPPPPSSPDAASGGQRSSSVPIDGGDSKPVALADEKGSRSS